jgi:hypothetical protein
MTDEKTNLHLITEEEYALLGNFVQPENDWLPNFYTPLERRLTHYKKQRKNNPENLEVAGMARLEIEMLKPHARSYGNAIFAMQR